MTEDHIMRLIENGVVTSIGTSLSASLADRLSIEGLSVDASEKLPTRRNVDFCDDTSPRRIKMDNDDVEFTIDPAYAMTEDEDNDLMTQYSLYVGADMDFTREIEKSVREKLGVPLKGMGFIDKHVYMICDTVIRKQLGDAPTRNGDLEYTFSHIDLSPKFIISIDSDYKVTEFDIEWNSSRASIKKSTNTATLKSGFGKCNLDGKTVEIGGSDYTTCDDGNGGTNTTSYECTDLPYPKVLLSGEDYTPPEQEKIDKKFIEYSVAEGSDGGVEITYSVKDKDGNDVTDEFYTLTVEDTFMHKEL